MSSKHPNKLTDLDKSHTKHGGVLIEHIFKTKTYISNETAEIVNFTFFIVSLLKLYVVIATRVLIRPEQNTFICPLPLSPTYKSYLLNMKICLTASEEKSFENVHDGRRWTDGRRIPAYIL